MRLTFGFASESEPDNTDEELDFVIKEDENIDQLDSDSTIEILTIPMGVNETEEEAFHGKNHV